MSLDELMSPDDLAAYLQVPVKTIYNWRSEGKGPRGIRVGRYLRYRTADVKAWLERLADDDLGGNGLGTKLPPRGVARLRGR